MSKHFNVSLFPMFNYNKKELQVVSWLLLIAFKEACAKKVVFFTWDTLFHPIFFKFLGFQMSKHFNVSLFPMSKYNNKEPQVVSWLLLIDFKDAFAKKVFCSHGTHYFILSYLSFLASNCPNTSMFLYFPCLTIIRKSCR